MIHIRTIKQLTDILDDIEPDEQVKAMKLIQIAASELAPFARWNPQDYTRNCLARTEKYELILLCWDKKSKTPIHGHGGEDCWVYQVQGTVEEIRYKEHAGNLIETNRMQLMPKKLTYMNDDMGFHAIENNGDQRAMTLHIYASPIDSCKVYNDEKDCFEIKELFYDSFKGNEVQPLVS